MSNDKEQELLNEKWYIDSEKIVALGGAKAILHEPNVEVREQLLKVFGIERFLKELDAKSVDAEGGYILYNVTLGKEEDLANCRCLKMKNPSVPNLDHYEMVPNNCKTIVEALHERKPEVFKKIPINLTGAKWYQQGDVYIWPKGATSIRPLPAVLT